MTRRAAEAGDDLLYDEAGNDALFGDSDKHILFGGSGKEKLSDGTGADKPYGGSRADTLVFASVKDSTVAASGRDTIYDAGRKQGDKIDLKGIDASTEADGNQAFSVIGADKFSKTPAELRYEKKGGDTFGDVNADGKADFSIRIDASIDFAKAHFLL